MNAHCGLLTLSLVLISSYLQVSACPPTSCGENEILKNQGTDCYTCANYLWTKCAPKNETKCYCKDGYVRDESNNNKCTLTTDCPTPTKEIVCGKNEIIKDQGFDCQTCRNYQYVRCASINKRQCFCKDGYVRNDDNVCTATEDCPKY